jgi:hypothetical protein
LFDIPGLFVHTEISFTPVKNIWIKSNNTWIPVAKTYVRDNSAWQPLLGSFAPVFDVIKDIFGQAPRPNVEVVSPTFDLGSGWEGGDQGITAAQCGGGSSGCKIICTKLHELGLMSEDIYLADQEFGAELIKIRPDIYHGYRAWAEIVVDWMNGSGPKMMPWMTDKQFSVAIKKWSTAWAHDIATPWAEEMAFKMGKIPNSSLTGRMITAVGVPICKVVGTWQRVFGPSKKPAGFGKGLALIVIFVMLKVVTALGKAIETHRN